MSIKVSRILYEEIVNSGEKPVFVDNDIYCDSCTYINASEAEQYACVAALYIYMCYIAIFQKENREQGGMEEKYGISYCVCNNMVFW